LLRADEEHRPVPLSEVPRERGRLLEELLRLLEVDDVDPAALAEDEAAHLGSPASSLVAEVNPGLQELSHGYDCQNCLLMVVFGTAGGAGWTARREGHPHTPSRA